jgi:uncharacterized membrane protein YidH (DUF202 family)
MPDKPVHEEPLHAHNRRVHMANERTFLAWMRTSIGLMAFGFVVEKFALFVKQLTYFLQKSEGGAAGQPFPTAPGYSAILGIMLVAIGLLMVVLAFVRYKKVEKQIDEDMYQPSILLDIMLAISVLAIGLFLVIYLVHSV